MSFRSKSQAAATSKAESESDSVSELDSNNDRYQSLSPVKTPPLTLRSRKNVSDIVPGNSLDDHVQLDTRQQQLQQYELLLLQMQQQAQQELENANKLQLLQQKFKFNRQQQIAQSKTKLQHSRGPKSNTSKSKTNTVTKSWLNPSRFNVRSSSFREGSHQNSGDNDENDDDSSLIIIVGLLCCCCMMGLGCLCFASTIGAAVYVKNKNDHDHDHHHSTKSRRHHHHDHHHHHHSKKPSFKAKGHTAQDMTSDPSASSESKSGKDDDSESSSEHHHARHSQKMVMKGKSFTHHHKFIKPGHHESESIKHGSSHSHDEAQKHHQQLQQQTEELEKQIQQQQEQLKRQQEQQMSQKEQLKFQQQQQELKQQQAQLKSMRQQSMKLQKQSSLKPSSYGDFKLPPSSPESESSSRTSKNSPPPHDHHDHSSSGSGGGSSSSSSSRERNLNQSPPPQPAGGSSSRERNLQLPPTSPGSGVVRFGGGDRGSSGNFLIVVPSGGKQDSRGRKMAAWDFNQKEDPEIASLQFNDDQQQTNYKQSPTLFSSIQERNEACYHDRLESSSSSQSGSSGPSLSTSPRGRFILDPCLVHLSTKESIKVTIAPDAWGEGFGMYVGKSGEDGNVYVNPHSNPPFSKKATSSEQKKENILFSQKGSGGFSWSQLGAGLHDQFILRRGKNKSINRLIIENEAWQWGEYGMKTSSQSSGSARTQSLEQQLEEEIIAVSRTEFVSWRPNMVIYSPKPHMNGQKSDLSLPTSSGTPYWHRSKDYQSGSRTDTSRKNGEMKLYKYAYIIQGAFGWVSWSFYVYPYHQSNQGNGYSIDSNWLYLYELEWIPEFKASWKKVDWKKGRGFFQMLKEFKIIDKGGNYVAKWQHDDWNWKEIFAGASPIELKLKPGVDISMITICSMAVTVLTDKLGEQFDTQAEDGLEVADFALDLLLNSNSQSQSGSGMAAASESSSQSNSGAAAESSESNSGAAESESQSESNSGAAESESSSESNSGAAESESSSESNSGAAESESSSESDSESESASQSSESESYSSGSDSISSQSFVVLSDSESDTGADSPKDITSNTNSMSSATAAKDSDQNAVRSSNDAEDWVDLFDSSESDLL